MASLAKSRSATKTPCGSSSAYLSAAVRYSLLLPCATIRHAVCSKGSRRTTIIQRRSTSSSLSTALGPDRLRPRELRTASHQMPPMPQVPKHLRHCMHTSKCSSLWSCCCCPCGMVCKAQYRLVLQLRNLRISLVKYIETSGFHL